MRAALALPLVLLMLSAAVRAEVRCFFGEREIKVDEVWADFTYVSLGKRDAAMEHVSRFRLMTVSTDDGPGDSAELKTVDVMKPGVHKVVDESGWRSNISVHGKKQRVVDGRFDFKVFEVHGSRGHATGRVEFRGESTAGRCLFDVDFDAIDFDRVKGL